jgi:hypothetical protein
MTRRASRLGASSPSQALGTGFYRGLPLQSRSSQMDALQGLM